MLRIKRICDVVGSIACIIILSPLLLLIGIVTKLTIRGSVIFTQTRLGYLQNDFEILKFRTIAEKNAQNATEENEETDERIPPFSRFLRRTKLDELPQLFNVLKGDMSFVGPRPYIKEDSTGLNPERYLMKPGITGLGQVNGNRELDWEERTAYDIDYIRHYSLWLDIRILLKTVLVIVLGENKLLKGHEPMSWNRFHWYLADIKPLTIHEGDSLWRKKLTSGRIQSRYRGTDTDIVLEAKRGYGKVTDCGNDRFRCIYTKIPAECDFRFETEVTVVSFLHEPGPNHRESFGIFIRDTMDPDPSTGEYYSNMAALGGYYGRYNFFGRTGISPDSIEDVKNFFLYPKAGESEGVFSHNPLHYRICPERPIRIHLVMHKVGPKVTVLMTDSEGNDLLAPSHNGGDNEIVKDGSVLYSKDGYSVSLPDAFSRRNPSWVYLGYEVADGSKLLVHKDSVKITLTKTNKITAGTKDSSQNNAIGKEASHRSKKAEIPEVVLAADGNRNFAKNAKGRIWIVTPDGTSEGTGAEDSPMALQTAIEHCRPGDTVLVKAGKYLLDSSVCIERSTPDCGECRRTLQGVIGQTIFDFQEASNALILRGDNWVVDGICVTRGHGIKIEGNHNIVRNCRAYRNKKTGIIIRHPDISSSKDEWPSGNLIEYCVSYENCDVAECNADGFACKVAAGAENCFRYCVAWLNTDDGFDLFSKNRTIGSVSLEHCQSYFNGYRIGENGRLIARSGNGNGFKLGGGGLAVKHDLTDCTAIGNKAYGFTSNSNPIMRLNRCVAYQNGHLNCHYYYYAVDKVRPEKSIQDCSFEDVTGFNAEELLKQLREQYTR